MLYSKFFAGRELKGIRFGKDGYSETKVSPEKLKLLKTFGVEEKDRASIASATEKADETKPTADIGFVPVDKTKRLGKQ